MEKIITPQKVYHWQLKRNKSDFVYIKNVKIFFLKYIRKIKKGNKRDERKTKGNI